MSDLLGWIPGLLEELGQAHLLRARRQVVSLPDGWCEIDGRRLRNFAGNDYLGLAQHPRLQQMALRALAEAGCGSGASPLVSGRSRWMVELDRWVVRLSGAPEETINRTSSESFSTDKLGNDQWTRLASTDEVSYPCMMSSLVEFPIR